MIEKKKDSIWYKEQNFPILTNTSLRCFFIIKLESTLNILKQYKNKHFPNVEHISVTS